MIFLSRSIFFFHIDMNFKLFHCRSAINNVFLFHTGADKTDEVEIFTGCVDFCAGSAIDDSIFVMNSVGLRVFDLFWSIFFLCHNLMRRQWPARSQMIKFSWKTLDIYLHPRQRASMTINDWNAISSLGWDCTWSLKLCSNHVREWKSLRVIRKLGAHKKASWNEMWRFQPHAFRFLLACRRDNLREMVVDSMESSKTVLTAPEFRHESWHVITVNCSIYELFVM